MFWFRSFNRLLVLLLLLTITQNILASQNVDMFVGEVKVFGQVAVNRIAIGNGKVIRGEVLKNGELIVIAEAPGSSSLRLWNKDGSYEDFNVRVTENDPETRIRMESMVRMNVKMFEFRKSVLGELGIKWDTDINGPAFSTAGDFISNNLFRSPDNSGIGSTMPLYVTPFSTHFGIATAISSRIKYLESNGDAVTLAEPNLSCINGGSAKFLAGGEIPYPVTGANGQVNVEFKEYGVKLDISPKVDSSGNIYTKILTEVSQVDPSTTVLDVPGLITRRTETEVNVIAGQTIVISGLLNAENSKDSSKVKGLGDIPILGALFKSKDYRNSLTELVIFVTPQIIKQGRYELSDREQMLYKRRTDALNQIGESIDYNIMD
jgi:pilus assembly protein CpaC